MKKFLPVIFILAASFCNAQNYQCLQSGVKHYFTNGNGYLRGIRIDSVRTSGSDVIYYPFHTPRGPWHMALGLMFTIVDSNGGSWLGKKVIQQNDGTFLFDNLWGDTVIIKTQASVGDTWIFCRDTSSLYYRASVTSVDTMTVLGVIDSVKKILITAHNGAGIVTTDPANNFQIVLSQNYGFAEVCDMYTFPYHRPGSAWSSNLDYYMDHPSATGITYTHIILPDANSSIFKLTSFFNPTSDQLGVRDIGDVYEVSSQSSVTWGPNGYDLDTIITKTILPHSTIYSFSGLAASENILTYTWSVSYRSGSYTTNDATYLLDTTKMPEELGCLAGINMSNVPATGIYYFPDDGGFCTNSAAYRVGYIEDYGVVEKYKIGFGTTYHYEHIDLYSTENKLIYSDKGGSPCGSYRDLLSLQINNYNIDKEIKIYPNPATTELTITSTNKIASVTITNLVGQTVYTNKYDKEKIQVNIAGLPGGVYFIKINGSEVRKFVKE